MSDEQNTQEPLQTNDQSENKRQLLMGLAVLVVIVLAIGGFFLFHKSPPHAPTQGDITSNVLKDWNKYDAYWTTKNQTVTCAYDPSRYRAGYRFECNIFNGQGVGIGTAQVLANADVKGNYSMTITLQPNP